jgi:hypothetical protein
LIGQLVASRTLAALVCTTCNPLRENPLGIVPDAFQSLRT